MSRRVSTHGAAVTTALVPSTRAINTTSPLTGGGALTGDLTLGIQASSASQAGSMSAAQAAQLVALVSSADPLSAFTSYQSITTTARYTDFLTTSTGAYPYSAFGSGTGNASNWSAAVAGRAGLVTLETGTTTTGSYYIGTNTSAISFGSGTYRWRADGFAATASDGTETYTMRLGFIDATSGECTDGAYFRGTHSVNGGRWECVTRSNSVETATDSGIAMVSATCQTFEIEVNAGATSVAFKIAGATVQTHVANIPSGIARAVGAGLAITKSAGTTSRAFVVDLMGDRFERTAAI